MSSAGRTLAEGTWDDARTLIGETIAAFEGADAVNTADIRRKLEVIGLDCALHYDEAFARRHGYETIVSPVSMARVWAMPPYWQPGEGRPGPEPLTAPIAAASVPGEGDTMIAVSARTEHLKPLYPGDRVSATAVLESITEKTTRVGKGAFIVVATTYRNQHDEAVAVETTTLFRYESEDDA